MDQFVKVYCRQTYGWDIPEEPVDGIPLFGFVSVAKIAEKVNNDRPVLAESHLSEFMRLFSPQNCCTPKNLFAIDNFSS